MTHKAYNHLIAFHAKNAVIMFEDTKFQFNNNISLSKTKTQGSKHPLKVDTIIYLLSSTVCQLVA